MTTTRSHLLLLIAFCLFVAAAIVAVASVSPSYLYDLLLASGLASAALSALP